jgi:opacity protein-like surface antigen
MKKAWLSTLVGLPALVTSAFSADLHIRMPAPPPMPSYNWSGFYIGANLGGAWGSGALTDNLTGASFSGDHSGFIGGGTLGYNWQVSPNLIIGVEGTIDGTSIGTTSNVVTVPVGGVPTPVQGSVGTDWIATLAGRIGITQNNLLYYFKGGGGWVNNSATLTNTVTGASVSGSNTRSGWLIGGGIEYGIDPRWTLKAEYDYLKLDDWTNSGPLFPGDTFTLSRHIGMFTVGANYKLSPILVAAGQDLR